MVSRVIGIVVSRNNELHPMCLTPQGSVTACRDRRHHSQLQQQGKRDCITALRHNNTAPQSAALFVA